MPLMDNELLHTTSLKAILLNEGVTLKAALNPPGGIHWVMAKVIVETIGETPMTFIAWSCGCEDTIEEYAGPMYNVLRTECCRSHALIHPANT